MVVQVRDGQVVIRQGHCRHRAIPLANKIRAERGEGPVDKIRVDEFRGSDSKAELLILKETINFRSRSLLRLSPCIACTTAQKSL